MDGAGYSTPQRKAPQQSRRETACLERCRNSPGKGKVGNVCCCLFCSVVAPVLPICLLCVGDPLHAIIVPATREIKRAYCYPTLSLRIFTAVAVVEGAIVSTALKADALINLSTCTFYAFTQANRYVPQ